MSKKKELILYLVFGVLTTVVNWIAFGIFKQFTPLLIANVIAWVFAVAFAYVTNKLFVFESKSWEKNVFIKEVISFTGARLFSLGVEELGLIILVNWLKLTPALGNFAAWCFDLTQKVGFKMPDIFYEKIDGEMVVKILLAFIVIVLNYFFSKLIIFKKKDKDITEEK